MEGADRGSQRGGGAPEGQIGCLGGTNVGCPCAVGHIGCLLGKGGPERGADPFDIDLSGLGRDGFGRGGSGVPEGCAPVM